MKEFHEALASFGPIYLSQSHALSICHLFVGNRRRLDTLTFAIERAEEVCSQEMAKFRMNDVSNPFRRRGRDGIIPTTSGEATSGRNYEFPMRHERQFQFPKSWFSRRGEKQISTTRGGASSGRNSFFHYNC